MSDPQSKSEHILSLARSFDDIELARLPADQLVLKVSRLARLIGSGEIKQWLKYELQGYPGSGELSTSTWAALGDGPRKRRIWDIQ